MVLTFPLGGLVNHSVHLFWRGCLTLKLSLSWKTVTGLSSSLAATPSPLPLGEMGMVERSTCWSILGVSTAVAMVYIFRSTLYDFEIDEGEAAKWGNEQSN